jgi:hypothetical protein
MRSQRQKALVLLVVVVILGGCSGVRVSQDYDPVLVAHRNDTWQWEQSAQPMTGDLRVDNPLLNNRIRRAIESHLVGRYMAQEQRQPALYVSYHLSIQPKLQSYSSYSTLGMGGYYYPWAWDYYSDNHIYQYDECQLTIDIKAADTKSLVWRGTGVYRYKTYKSPEAAAKDMQRTVDRILTQFPPAKS